MLDAFAFPLLAYPATISLSTSSLTCLTRALQANRVAIRSPWHGLAARNQVLLVLAWIHSNFATLDKTVVRTNRIRAHARLSYSGQHKQHGVNLQGLTDPHGRLRWISDGLPGSTHDLTAARHHNVLASVARAELYLYVDKGDVGGEANLLLVPSKGRHLPTAYRDANKLHAAIRARGERGFATLRNWHILDRVRACPRRIGALAQAIFTLQNEG